MKKILVTMSFLASGNLWAAEEVFARYIYWDEAGTVVSGPFHSIGGDPISEKRTGCNGRYPPYSVRIINETTGDEHTFICEEVNAQK